METRGNKKCGFSLFLAVFGALIFVASVAALIVKFFVMKDVKYSSCYQCGCDDAEDDDFDDDEDDDFVNDEDKE